MDAPRTRDFCSVTRRDGRGASRGVYFDGGQTVFAMWLGRLGWTPWLDTPDITCAWIHVGLNAPSWLHLRVKILASWS